MLDAVAGVGARVCLLGPFVGRNHHVNGTIAVGVDADLEPGLVHLHHPLVYLVGLHGEDAVVAAATFVGGGQVGGTGGNGPVGHHLDTADTQAFVAEAGHHPGVPQRGEVGVVEQAIDPQGQVAVLVALLVGGELIGGNPRVVDAGQTRRVEHSADSSQALPPDFRGLHWNQAESHRFNGPLVDHAVQFPGIRVPAQAAAGRIGGVAGEAGQLHTQAVHVVNVAGAVGHQDGVFHADGVQVGAVKETVLGGLGIVELEALDPLARWRNIQPFAEFVLDGGDGGLGAVGGHNVADAAVQDVDMGVDKAGQDGLAVQVQHPGIRAHPIGHVVGAAHGGKSSVQHGERLGPGTAAVDGDDVGVADDGVCVNGGHCRSPSGKVGVRSIGEWVHRKGWTGKRPDGCSRQSRAPAGGQQVGKQQACL